MSEGAQIAKAGLADETIVSGLKEEAMSDALERKQ